MSDERSCEKCVCQVPCRWRLPIEDALNRRPGVNVPYDDRMEGIRLMERGLALGCPYYHPEDAT
jgi:hypothetical protein